MLAVNKQTKTGFSLLELLLYISILSILMVIISSAFISLSRGSGQAQAKSEVNGAIRFTTELLKQDIKNASAISTPSLGTASPSLSLTRDGSTIVYDVVTGVLRRKVGTAAPVAITSSEIFVSPPTFTRIENSNTVFSVTDTSIRINLTFSYASTTVGWNYSDSLQTSVGVY